MSEEQKAIKRLEEMTINYKLNSKDLHYAIILFNYIKNLQQENKQLEDRINKAIEFIEEHKDLNVIGSETIKVYSTVLLKILKGDSNE